MVGVCCGCIAKPASVQPRKTYNILNAQLFAGSPIRTDEALDATLLRRIQKLQEYVQANPAKIPKVSRRLMRRIKATLQKPGDNLGYVKVAVYAYIYMLAHSVDDSSSYSPSFFAREIVSGPDAVVPLLLKDIHIEMRTLGAELLAVFTKVQSQVDNKLDAIQEHIPQVCRAAQAALNADRKEQKLQETAERRRAGKKLAVPNPLDLVARWNPVHVAALEVACLRCLAEVVALCMTSKVLPRHLTAVQAVALDNLRQSRRGTNPGSTSSAPATAEFPDVAPAAKDVLRLGILDTAFYQAAAIQKGVPQGWEPRQLAGRLLQLLGEFTKDVATVHKVMNSFYEYLDEQHRWQEQEIVKELLQMLNNAGSFHQFPIYASLLRHATSSRLSTLDASVVVRLAAEKGAALDERYSLSALALALAHMPKVWALQAQKAPKGIRVQAFLDNLRVTMSPVGREFRMSGTADPGAVTATSSSSVMLTKGAAAAVQSGGVNGVSTVPANVQIPPVDPSHVTEQHDVELFRQQIAYLRREVQSAVQLLSKNVGTAAELCEVLVGVLAAVAAELGLAPADVVDGIAAQNVDAAVAQAREPVEKSHLDNRLTVDADPRVSDGHAGGQVDEARVGLAAMMLQCAAAATNAFAQQCISSDRPAATDGALRTASKHLLVLPGGVLPSSLVTSALPLLRTGSEVIRWPVKQLLLALLPAASKGIGSDKLAAELAETLLAGIRSSSHKERHAVCSSPDAVAATDQILRCCLRSPKPRPGVALTIAQTVLQLQCRWSAEGYRSVGGGDVSVAHAVLLLVNSQLAALAEALNSPGLLSQQLPLAPDSCPALRFNTDGLSATGAAADGSASEAVLSALEQQPPQHSTALEAMLLQAPALVSEYGGQLQQLLKQDLAGAESTAGSEGGARAKQGQMPFNALLGKRMSSLRRDLVHVSEIMRHSMSRLQDPPSAHSLSALPPSTDQNDQDDPSRQAIGPDFGGHTATDMLSNSVANKRVASYCTTGLEGDAATRVASAANPAVAQQELGQQGAAGAAIVAGLQQGSSLATRVDHAEQQQPTAVDTDNIKLQGLKKTGSNRTTLSAQVAEVLRQPAAAGAFVVRDVKISQIAGELEPVIG